MTSIEVLVTSWSVTLSIFTSLLSVKVLSMVIYVMKKIHKQPYPITQSALAYSKLTTETLEQVVKYVQRKQ